MALLLIPALVYTQTYELKYPASSKSSITLKNIEVVSTSVKPPTPETRLYQDVKVSKEELKGMLWTAFNKYGISDQIPIAEKVIFCESGWNINANNGISYGIAQFTKATWKDFGYGDIFNPQSQFMTMGKMWKAGLQGRWNCFYIVQQKTGS